MAETLAEHMQECGHDVIALDLLDCLATAGLELGIDPDGTASLAFFDLLAKR